MISKYIIVSDDKRIPHSLAFETNIAKYDVDTFIHLAINGGLEIDEHGELWFDITSLTEHLYEALKSCEGVTLRFYHFLDQTKPSYIPLSAQIYTFDDNYPPVPPQSYHKNNTVSVQKTITSSNGTTNTNSTTTTKNYFDKDNLNTTVNFDIGSKIVSVDRVVNTAVINKYFCANPNEFEDEDLVAIQFSDNTIVYIDKADYDEHKDEISIMNSKAVAQKFGICAE